MSLYNILGILFFFILYKMIIKILEVSLIRFL